MSFNPQIYAVFPSNKVGLFIDDATGFDRPKIRVALVPTGTGDGSPVAFYLDFHEARVLFLDLQMGQLNPMLQKQNKHKDAAHGFDRWTKMEGGYRTFTMKDKPDGVGLRIVNHDGMKLYQVAYLSAWQVRVMAFAVSAYIQQVDVVRLAHRLVDPELPGDPVYVDAEDAA